jgi:xanthine dehydrogenase accessory factor
MLARSAPESKKLALAVRQGCFAASSRWYVGGGEKAYDMTADDDLETITGWAAGGERVALATVVETQRSAPRPVGAKLAVTARGGLVGAVSGGCVEGAVIEVAERVLAGGAPQLLTYGLQDSEAWEIGLPCGGELSVWVQEYDPAGLEARFIALGREGRRAVLVTALDGVSTPGAKLLVTPDAEPIGTLGGDGSLDAAALALAREALWSERSALHTAGGATLFLDVAAPPPRLIIIGAVDLAAHLTAIAALSGWRSFVIDPRSRFATAQRFPAAERTIVAWPGDALVELAPLDRGTAICVLAHDPKLDDAALLAALTSEAGYIGAIGSRRTQAKRRERLLAAGAAPSALERIAGPIGLDLGSATPAETALSIMSEIVAVRRGHAGGRLVDGAAAIHRGAVPEATGPGARR